MSIISENFKKSFYFQLLLVVLIALFLYTMFFMSLHWITKHGEEVKIPDVRGKDITTAITQLKTLQFEVSVDSTYEAGIKPNIILKQIPDTGSVVKQGRTIFLTVSKSVAPFISMPNIVGLTLRSAALQLRNNKLLMGDTTYAPDIAKDVIKQMLFNGKELNANEMIPQGSKISLVIGNGRGNESNLVVPNVVKYTVNDAQTVIDASLLQSKFLYKGDITDTQTAIVVAQLPRVFKEDGITPNKLNANDTIVLIIVQNPTEDDFSPY